MKYRLPLALLAFACMALFGPATPLAQAETFDPWGYSATIRFPGFTTTRTLTNFPVLVVISPQHWQGFQYSQMAFPQNGADLRFSDVTQTQALDFEIESWNTNGNSYVWVRLPTLTSATILSAFWGNASASTLPAASTNGAVWDTDFRGVWHLSDSLTDATRRGRNGVNNGSTDTAQGIAGGGQAFNGASYVSVAHHADLTFGSSETRLTIEAWIKTSRANSGLFSKGRPTSNGNIDYVFNQAADGISLWRWSDLPSPSGTSQAAAATKSSLLLNDNAWHHVAFVNVSGARQELYVDGKLIGTAAAFSGDRSNTHPFEMGRYKNNTHSTDYYAGEMDEVRFSRTTRSSNWVWTCWANQGNPANFQFVAGAGRRVGQAGIETSRATGIGPTAADLNATLTATGMTKTVVYVCYGTSNGGFSTSAWNHVTSLGAPPLGNLHYRWTNLTPSATYYFTFLATNNAGSAWSSKSMSFKTLPGMAAFEDWKFHTSVTIDGYTGTETLRDFPTLVVFEEGVIPNFDYATFASADGSDLRFSDNQGREIPSQIEQWNPNGKSYVWVRVPELQNGTVLWAYWGNPAAPTPAYASDGSLWTNGYRAVWHLNETNLTDETVGGIVRDSSASHLDGIQNNHSPIAGKIGMAQYFDNVSDFVTLGSSPKLTLGPVQTFSAWVRPDSFGGSDCIMAKNAQLHAPYSYIIGLADDRKLLAYDNNGATMRKSADAGITVGNWHHVAYVMKGNGTVDFYVNGQAAGSTDFIYVDNPEHATYIGKYGIADGYHSDFHGVIDELNVSTNARSADWIRASWKSQADNEGFLSFSPIFPYTDIQTLSPIYEKGSRGILRADLLSTGNTETVVFCYYGTNDGATVAAQWDRVVNLGPQSEGIVSAEVNDLSLNDRYYFYRFYSSNVYGGAWAQQSVKFRTDVYPTNLLVWIDETYPAYRLELIWSTNYTTETGFRVDRSLTGTGDWKVAASLPANSYTYLDDFLQPGTRYFYRIAVTNNDGLIEFSNIEDQTTRFTALSAESFTWAGAAANDNWTTFNNWTPNTAMGKPDRLDTISFAGAGSAPSAGATSSILDEDFIVRSIAFANLQNQPHGLNVPAGTTLQATEAIRITSSTANNGPYVALLGQGTIATPLLAVQSSTRGLGTLDLSACGNRMQVNAVTVGECLGNENNQGRLVGLGATTSNTLSVASLLIGAGAVELGPMGTLMVSNSVTIGKNSVDAALGQILLTSGSTLRVGTPGARASLLVGERGQYAGTGSGILVSAKDSTCELYLNNLEIASSVSPFSGVALGTLDLSLGSTRLDMAGSLLQVGWDTNSRGLLRYGSSNTGTVAVTFARIGLGTVDVGPAGSLLVDDTLNVGNDSMGTPDTPFFGELQLKGGLLRVGTAQARAAVRVGQGSGINGRACKGVITATAGSTVNWRLNALVVGRDENSQTGTEGRNNNFGTVDLGALTLVADREPAAGEALLDVGTLDIGSSTLGGAQAGFLRLGTGPAQVNTLMVGGSQTNFIGTMRLQGTILTVTGNASVGQAGGSVIVDVGSVPAGLSIRSGANIINNVVLRFTANPATNVLWAMRITGNNKPLLDNWLLNGNVAIRNEGMSAALPVTTYFDAAANYSYIGVNLDAIAAPCVINTGATNVQARSAWLNGRLVSEGASATTVDLFWGTRDGGEDAAAWEHQVPIGVTAKGATLTSQVLAEAFDTRYYFRYRASNGSGIVWAFPATSWSTAFEPSDAPSDLIATPATPNEVMLRWTDRSATETAFLAEHSTDNQTWQTAGSVMENGTSFRVTGLNRATLYYFRVTALNTLHRSEPSTAVTATTLSTYDTSETYAWDDGAGDDKWSSGTNWNPNAAAGQPGYADNLRVLDTSPGHAGASLLTQTMIVDRDFRVSSLAFTTQAGKTHGLRIVDGATLAIDGNLDFATTASDGAPYLALLGKGTLTAQTFSMLGDTRGNSTLDLSASSNSISISTFNVGRWTGGVTPDTQASSSLVKGLGAAGPQTVTVDDLHLGWGTIDIAAQGTLRIQNSALVGRHNFKTAPLGEILMAPGATLEIGSAIKRAALVIGEKESTAGDTVYGVIRSLPGSHVAMYLDSLTLGSRGAGYVTDGRARGTLDLGEGLCLLDVSGEMLRVGAQYQTQGYLRFGYQDTLRSTVDVRKAHLGLGTIDVGAAGTLTARELLRIGHDNDDGNAITKNFGQLNIRRGSLSVGTERTRAVMEVGIGSRAAGASSRGIVTADSGSRVLLMLSTLTIGRDDNAATGAAGENRNYGTVDLGMLRLTDTPYSLAAGQAFLDAGTVDIAGYNNGGEHYGYLRLGAGKVNIGKLFVGASATRKGILLLNGTQLKVSSAINISQLGGTLDVTLGSEPAGIDFLSSSTPSFLLYNTALTFTANPSTKELWGIRMQGNQTAFLGALITTKRVVVKRAGISPEFAVGTYFNTNGNYSYIGIKAEATALPIVNNLGGATGTVGLTTWLNGNLVSAGASPATVRFHWGTRDVGGVPAGWDAASSLGIRNEGPLSVQVTASDADRNFFYRYSASNATGRTWASPAGQWSSPFAADAKPVGLTATPLSAFHVDLRWTDPFRTETGFLLEYSTDGANWTYAGTASANALRYRISGLEAETLYNFRVTATNAFNRSSPALASTRTLPAPSGANVFTWDDEAGDDLWNTPANWNPSATPSGPDILTSAILGNTGGAASLNTPTVKVAGDRAVRTLSVRNTLNTARHGLQIQNNSTLTAETLSIDPAADNAYLALLGSGTLYADTLTVANSSASGKGTLDLSQSSNTVQLTTLDVGRWTGSDAVGDQANNGMISGLGAGGPVTMSVADLHVGWGTVDIGSQGWLTVSRSVVLGKHNYSQAAGEILLNSRGAHVRIGSADSRATMVLGQKTSSSAADIYGYLRPKSGTDVALYLSSLELGKRGTENLNLARVWGVLDLSSGTNRLDLFGDALRVGADYQSHGFLNVGATPDSVADVAVNSVYVGHGTVDIGRYATVQATLSLKVGHDADDGNSGLSYIGNLRVRGGKLIVGSSLQRAPVEIGRGNRDGGRSCVGLVTAEAGSIVDLRCTTLNIGNDDNPASAGYGSNKNYGTLDLRNLELSTAEVLSAGQARLDASVLELGSSTAGGGQQATLLLGRGTANAGNLKVGGSGTGQTGLLDLNGTLLRVGTNVICLTGGSIQVTIKNTSCGLDLLNTQWIPQQIRNVTLSFTENPARRELFGMRMAGNNTTYLNSLISSKNVIAKNVGMVPDVAIGVYYNSASNYSYIGVNLTNRKHPLIGNAPGITSVTDTNITVQATLVTTGSAATAVSVYWGSADGGSSASAWDHSQALGQRNEGLLTASIPVAPEGLMHYYRFFATNAFGGAWASPLFSWPLPFAPGNAPTALTAAPKADFRVDLTWRDNASTETGFRVERSTDGNTWVPAGTAQINSERLSVLNLAANTLYYLRICATNQYYASAYATVQARTLARISTAQNYTWDAGSPVDRQWTSSNNWAPDSADGDPDILDAVTFSQAGIDHPYDLTTIMDDNYIVASMAFRNKGTDAHTLAFLDGCKMTVDGDFILGNSAGSPVYVGLAGSGSILANRLLLPDTSADQALLETSRFTGRIEAEAVELGKYPAGSGSLLNDFSASGSIIGFGKTGPCVLLTTRMLIGRGTLDIQGNGNVAVRDSLILGQHNYGDGAPPVGLLTLATNAVFTLGAPEAPASLLIAERASSDNGLTYGVLKPEANSTCRLYLNSLTVGTKNSVSPLGGYTYGTLDLSLGNSFLNLTESTLAIGSAYNSQGAVLYGFAPGSGSISVDWLDIGNGKVEVGPTGTLTVRNTLDIGDDHFSNSSAAGVGGIVDIKGGYLVVGTPTATADASIARSKSSTGGQEAHGLLRASANSRIAMYLNTLSVARDEAENGAISGGTVDLTALKLVSQAPIAQGECFLNVQNIEVAGNTGGGSRLGVLRLGPGSIDIANLNVGGNSTAQSGIMALNGTVVTVSGNMVTGLGGSYTNTIGETPSGLYFKNRATDITKVRRYHMIFTKNPRLSAGQTVLWGLKMDGNRTAAFNGLTSGVKPVVTCDIRLLGDLYRDSFKVVYDDVRDVTMLGIEVPPPPNAMYLIVR